MASCKCGCGHREKANVEATAARYTADMTVGEIGRDPAARAVLERFSVNHCCGAHLSLREGAAAAGVPLTDLLQALNAPAPVST